MTYETRPSGREHPSAPSHLIAPEAGQPLDHGDPRLRGNVLLIHLTLDDAQVAHQGRVDVKPQARECRLVTALGAGKDTGELLADHTRSIGWKRPARSRSAPASADRPMPAGPKDADVVPWYLADILRSSSSRRALAGQGART